VGRKLGVANVLEGRVRKEGNQVRITAELIKADDGFQLWSETYDREVSHIFAAQDEIARAVASALQVKLLSANSAAIPANSTHHKFRGLPSLSFRGSTSSPAGKTAKTSPRRLLTRSAPSSWTQTMRQPGRRTRKCWKRLARDRPDR